MLLTYIRDSLCYNETQFMKICQSKLSVTTDVHVMLVWNAESENICFTRMSNSAEHNLNICQQVKRLRNFIFVKVATDILFTWNMSKWLHKLFAELEHLKNDYVCLNKIYYGLLYREPWVWVLCRVKEIHSLKVLCERLTRIIRRKRISYFLGKLSSTFASYFRNRNQIQMNRIYRNIVYKFFFE